MGTAATDRSEMQVNFTNATSLYGFYCYDAHHGTTAAYATYQDVASREVCQQICASDASCNFYGWHGSSVSLEAPSRCYNCALYQTCQFQRTSVCKDITPPSNFEKSVKDAAAQRVEKEFTADFELNGQFCQRSQVFAAQVANESLCRSFCESIEDCKVMAFYMDARVREDAAPDSCDQNCRLYAECDSPVPSLCFHPPVLWSVLGSVAQWLSEGVHDGPCCFWLPSFWADRPGSHHHNNHHGDHNNNIHNDNDRGAELSFGGVSCDTAPARPPPRSNPPAVRGCNTCRYPKLRRIHEVTHDDT